MSAYKNLGQWKDTISEKIAFILLCTAFGGALCFVFCLPTKGDVSVAWISAFIGIANALLLFATLQSQNRNNSIQKEAADRERFETTFFNLLKSHRQLVDEISINRPSVRNDDISEVKYLIFKGRQFFSFAMIDINNILNSLKSNSLPYYEADKAFEQEGYLEECLHDPSVDVNVERWKSVQSSRIAMVNTYYNITVKSQKEYRKNANLPYLIFAQRHAKFYEHYAFSLTHLLKFVSDNIKDKNDLVKYIDIVISQMSKDEYEFITWLGPTKKELSELLKKTQYYNRRSA